MDCIECDKKYFKLNTIIVYGKPMQLHQRWNIDECAIIDCGPNAIGCTNTAGSYSCRCKLGYYGNGSVCNAHLYRGLGNSAMLHDYGSNQYWQDLSGFLSPVLQDASKSRWVRCWRAASDGWDVDSTFHRQCDNKGPTVSIVRVGSYIFGGYTDVSWDCK
ncbi:Nidogen-2 [Exaiptasia diaphana]|nr:Nidogen-2 [Exaiptasia diaphana]